MTTQSVNQAIVPGTESHFAQPAAAAATAEKPKRTRKPSRKVQAKLDAEYERGVTHGLNLANSQPSGLLLWMGVMLAVGLLIGRFWLPKLGL